MLCRLGGSEACSWFILLFQKQVHPSFSANRCFREGSPRDIKQNGIWMETWHPSLETFFIGYRFGGVGKNKHNFYVVNVDRKSVV